MSVQDAGGVAAAVERARGRGPVGRVGEGKVTGGGEYKEIAWVLADWEIYVRGRGSRNLRGFTNWRISTSSRNFCETFTPHFGLLSR